MYCKLNSFGLYGIDGCAVTVESDTAGGLPAFDIVGLPDAAVSESAERVRLAIKNSGYKFPVSRMTVNLAPADVRKTGAVYDLPILLSVLISTGQLKPVADDYAFLGEVALDGALRPVNGVLPMVVSASHNGIKTVFVPSGNACEASLVEGIEVFAASSCAEIIDHLSGTNSLTPVKTRPYAEIPSVPELDFADVKGQLAARRAMEIAAAGMHNILMIGPAGTGKSMLAKRLPSILPPLTYSEAIEVTKIYSVNGLLNADAPLVNTRPFRNPHYSVSLPGLTGGGSGTPKPGEISNAHRGVLFLDEFAEFPRRTLEALRAPLEDGKVTISRAATSISYPCEVMLVAAMNPCPCGNYGNPKKNCTCPPHTVTKYLSKVSGPLLDRIDLHVEVAAVDYDSISSSAPAESSAEIRKRVLAARELQRIRFGGDKSGCNAAIPPHRMAEICPMSADAKSLFKKAFDSLGLSARAHDKVLKVARTIADLAHEEIIQKEHIAEAVSYRSLDRKYPLG